MYDIEKYLDDPTSKWFGFHVIIGDFDNDPDTLMDVAILDRYNRLYSMNGWRIMNEPQKILFQRTAPDMFADPNVYNAFVSSVEGAKLRGFLKLTREERAVYKNNPDKWAEGYLEDNPGAFQPSLQATVRKWMPDFSSEYKLSEQSGIGKKDWNKVVNYAATTVAECLKEKSLVLNNITTNNYLYAMQEAYKIYYGRNLTGLVPQNFTNQIIVNKILYLKKKREDGERLKKERGQLDEYGIRVMNRLASNTDEDADRYNTNVVPELDNLIVPYKDYVYRDSPYISPDFVTSVDIATLLKNKFQKNSKVKKTDAEIKDILTTTQNLMNRTANPQLSLQSLANTPANESIFNDIINTANAQSKMKIEEAEDENNRINSLINNNNSSSSSSGSGAGFGVIPKKMRLNDDEDNELYVDNLIQKNYNNINDNPNAMSSGMPPSYINPALPLNANLINPI
jgi:hypothetical protein